MYLSDKIHWQWYNVHRCVTFACSCFCLSKQACSANIIFNFLQLTIDLGLPVCIFDASEVVVRFLVSLFPSPYQVGLRAQANFSAPTFEPAHEARAGKLTALSVYSSQLQLRCSNSITGPQASSSSSELSAKRAAKNVIALCRADRNRSSKSLAGYIQSKKRKSKVVRRSWKKEKKTSPIDLRKASMSAFVDRSSIFSAAVAAGPLSKSVAFGFFKFVAS